MEYEPNKNFNQQSQNIISRSSNQPTYKIGIFGGSVAQGLALYLQQQLHRQNSILKDQINVKVLNFAMPGYKQPQNLYAFIYALLAGQRFDCIINLDGFNEIISGHTNQQELESVLYPAARVWRAKAEELLSRLTGTQTFQNLEIKILEKNRSEEKNSKSGWLFAYNGVKKIIVKSCLLIIKQNGKGQNQWSNSDYFPMPPRELLSKPEDVLIVSRRIWLQSSIAMSQVAKGESIRYFHFFQPNQWDPRNGQYKPLAENHEYRWVVPLVQSGYKHFQEKTKSEIGVDLKIIDCAGFAEKQDSRLVWSDDCCHLTEEGNKLLWDFIKDKIKKP